MKQAPLIVVIYDGIQNSVFESQVITPLIKRLEDNPHQKIVIVSFEHTKPSNDTIQAKIPNHQSITFISCTKLRYIGTLSLHYAARTLHKILNQYAHYHILARGPLAGFICQKSVDPIACQSLTIQARGLLAEEYAYEHANENNSLKRLWHKFRLAQFFHVEQLAYRKQSICTPYDYTIEAVSKALGEYLITTYNAPRSAITYPQYDMPHGIAKHLLIKWKNEVRNAIDIPHNAPVYCYNGSIKAWQCPEKVILYFQHKLDKDSSSILYILTQDVAAFTRLICQHKLPAHTYRVLQVHHHDIYRYLAAADVGLMFREPHIVNWVSRPTKALEYMAAGLIIEHNNTVSWLIEHQKVLQEYQHTQSQPIKTEYYVEQPINDRLHMYS
jgi:hypothetical protein